MTVTNTTQKSVKTTAHPEVTSKIPAITNKTIPAAQSTIASKTDKPIQPASTKHSPTESGTHKTTAVPVTKPSSTLVTEASAIQGNPSGFSAGSFIGGIVLTLGLLAFGYIGCRFYHTKRGVQYRTILPYGEMRMMSSGGDREMATGWEWVAATESRTEGETSSGRCLEENGHGGG
ncbi:Porimin [Ophiophagus hannah]|uniref:Porimin n=1 Tax=Ophiophagus hannah TaxID=8665 RepID=V8NA83_OPHHA|nr:Porimin [Ophiophagus hannah]